MEAGLSSDAVVQYGTVRKYTLLLLFCVSQFLDAFNVSALFSAIPVMTVQLDLSASESVWLVSAYQLTFAAFLLCSGRIADIYNPKYAFISGAFALGIFSLIAGFVHAKVGLFVLRAFAGVAAAMTIPSSLTLLVRLFPGEKEQARAIGVYGGSAALGNVLGLIIGAIFIEYASWPWLFWLAALIATPIAFVCIVLVPAQPPVTREENKIALLDLPGISILTSALILLIFGFTSSGTESWSSAMVLAPLIISVFGIAAFFVWEARIDPKKAAFPPRTWRYPNFAILFAIALSIFLWFTTIFLLKITMWQEVYGWSAINAAIHFLPVGVIAGPIMLFSGPYTERFQKKHIILFSQVLLLISSIILAFADAPGKYWSRDFPAFVVGAIGGSLLFVNANVAIFHNTPPEIAGTVGAIFNSALQLGSAVGAALITSIQLTVDKSSTTDSPYKGREAGFWFLVGVISVEAIAVALMYRVTLHRTESVESDAATVVSDEKDQEKEKKTDSETGDLDVTVELQSAPLSRCPTLAVEAPSSELKEVEEVVAPVSLVADSRDEISPSTPQFTHTLLLDATSEEGHVGQHDDNH
ncbi:MFS general substrate transporter [Exidia glandulosa HHB12029]|uniref:MFS general substrate transporter n=1 Tax=Exidia glandulosa HHB12029 TaxID=1314781 RepID=A0A165LVG8_EXIGL|nr:MFS general substrate transporter [Exidia glandulosa HHB12029]